MTIKGTVITNIRKQRRNPSPSCRFDGSKLFVRLKFGVLNVLDKDFLANFLNHLHDIVCIGTCLIVGDSHIPDFLKNEAKHIERFFFTYDM
jgi:hypothetical protein